MKIRRIDHVGIIVDDLPAATAFFLDLGLEVDKVWRSLVKYNAMKTVISYATCGGQRASILELAEEIG
jgi:catechol 2,3-dioxygenase-like lactoylglutathione lyase family enzyme